MGTHAVEAHDAELAKKIIQSDYTIDELEVEIEEDDKVDKIKNDAYDRIKLAVSNHPDKLGELINLLLISRHLERIADHATNISEEVIYLIEGEIVRHAAYNRV